MNFASDNWAGATPEVMAALARANDGVAPAYGNDALTARVTTLFAEVFEREVEVWFTGTGTASNSLSLAGLSRPGGVVFCARDAHVQSDESNALEFQSDGMKLIDVPTALGKVQADGFAAALARHADGGRTIPVALSLTNATELGTVYAPDEVAELSAIARSRGLKVHLDGARFGNAVAATGATPAELTWKSGIDFMSFGATKNGCWAAEAIVVFTSGVLADMSQRRQRAGHTFSKSRFIAAQFEAYLTDGNWLRWAGAANARAEQMRGGLRGNGPSRLGWENPANEVFAVLTRDAIARARAAGATLYEWPIEGTGVTLAADEELVRLVMSWATSADEVERFLAIVQEG